MQATQWLDWTVGVGAIALAAYLGGYLGASLRRRAEERPRPGAPCAPPRQIVQELTDAAADEARRVREYIDSRGTLSPKQEDDRRD